MLHIYNTLTQQKELFTPIEPGKVKMYVCGVTVYDYCHVGHARVMVVFDTVTRYLRAKSYDVVYVRNITDVDDKIFNRANDNNESYDQLTTKFIKAMHEDEEALHVLRPDIEPRATQYIEEIVKMIQTLIDKGFAYLADNGDVYYRVKKFASYGKLSKKNIDELQVGARIDVEQTKEDPLDFALWKRAKEGEASWDSPFGAGRPGWHIECSAMSTHCLGNTFDIHGGGPDLPFPHHENEIAQSEAATGCQYVNTWMHAGAVRVDNEKMSKSLNNFFTIREVLDKYHPEVVRHLLIASHYRSFINYSEDSLKESRSALERFYTALDDVEYIAADEFSVLESVYSKRFYAAMDDDFNTPEAFAVLFDLARELNKAKIASQNSARQLAVELIRLANILGLLEDNPRNFLQFGGKQDKNQISKDEIIKLIAERDQARKDKNYQRSDDIRDFLKSRSVILKDSREGTTWFRE